MKSKILVPVDTARNSMTAEEHAIKLSWRMPVRVTLLTVLNDKRLQNRGISISDQERILEGTRKRAEEVLVQAAKPFVKSDIEHELRVETGNPGQVICKLAQEEGYDMVLIAQSGLSEWEEILGGSVVHTVLNKCQTPVLLVKHSPEQLDQQRRLRAEQELLPR